MDHGAMEVLGGKLGLWTALPFAGLLASIAILPVIARDFWLRHFALVAGVWTGVFAVPFLVIFGGGGLALILHAILNDYLPFIILIGALYTVCGGIVIAGTPRGNPLVNTALLLAGSVLASFVGTTGASMLLIRPFLRANASRMRRAHQVVFFIFLVSNIGGSLTPLGDPPLFLGFLHGVPFFWTLELFSHTAFVFLFVLSVFFALDTAWWVLEKRARRRGEAIAPDVPAATPTGRRLALAGGHNVAYLAGIVGAVLLSGVWHPGRVVFLGTELAVEALVRDAIIITMALLSWGTTRSELYRANDFSWFPLKEVAWLFAAVFITMVPAVAILRAGEHGALAGWVHRLESPVHFFWATGSLSSFLDNAPTYLSFLNLLLGKLAPGVPPSEGVRLLVSEHAPFVVAISTGAVFMGAITYIGNAPNFMVAAIAKENGVKMPGFIGYMLKYSIPVLLPVLWLMSRIYF